MIRFACASDVLDQTAKPAAEGRSPSGEFPTKWVVYLPQEGAAPGETIGAIESLIGTIGQSSGAGGFRCAWHANAQMGRRSGDRCSVTVGLVLDHRDTNNATRRRVPQVPFFTTMMFCGSRARSSM